MTRLTERLDFGWRSAFSAAIRANDLKGRGFSRAVCWHFVEEPGFSRALAGREARALAPEAGRLTPTTRSVNF
jgi:hypothetical protein